MSKRIRDLRTLHLEKVSGVGAVAHRFPLTATFNKLTIKIDRPQLSPEDIKGWGRR